MCLRKNKSVSKIIPKFLTELTGSKNLLAIEIEEICLRKDRSVSKIIPRFLTELTGSKNLFAIEMENDDNLERCIGVPIIIYSVLDGFRHRRLLVNQV